MAGNGAECKDPSKSWAAATFEKAKPYAFAETSVQDPEVVCSMQSPSTFISTRPIVSETPFAPIGASH
jgi:hypothetical protein